MSIHITDAKWKTAKTLLSRGYSWIEVVTYYKLLGGTQVTVYIFLENNRYKLLGLSDEDDSKVKLEDSLGEVVLFDYYEVKNARKIFSSE
ncbi:hypothetical protein BCPG3_020 [Bacillus phage BCPG3]|uniref:Uncharacterized protein n=2 Tax=Wphvirus TaxID=1922327 RepID=W5QUS6_9CAUD|nr:portal protein [Bacillus phage BPS10C]YP_009282035.1 portal protein [Bacillus phage SalinJah]QQO38743.1 long-tail fiber protein [Bacillus phage BCPG1]QSJ04337.1 hypothetical protein BCPG3_020 [Bacillus phage BCPG3]QSJ04551.1 hypothetical protein BCP18_019 [Bacillus phage BCP18]AGI12264.1 hypothetical protein BPS10C_267 [Bacillus phage BPS10C]ANH50722.1 hypothetical protein SALINJAH_81 [Bacillus phage SalinJah]